LSIVQNGRAYGDGVYTEYDDVSTPMSFAGPNGTVVVLQCLLTSDGLTDECASSLGSQASNPSKGSWVIFKDAALVLPVFLIDFSDPDPSDDSAELEMKKAAYYDAKQELVDAIKREKRVLAKRQ